MMKAEFLLSVFDLKDLPSKKLPEVLLVGRSNVGKSSLINAYLGRKNLARTSKTPGKTIALNYYLIDDAFYLVDAPGYGYAKRSFDEQNRFLALMDAYFLKKTRLSLVLMLVDFKVGPTKDDLMMIDFLKAHDLPFQVILTKADKVKPSEKIKTLKKIEAKLSGLKFLKTSSFKKEGFADLNEVIQTTIKEYQK